ncbi:DUF1120 domain-containing protein [Pantoea sp. GM01]|uniref:DUF1120 domain-containing protein n=1 Tax=Pantoea sp. GM01 TaxID=1144320 RepID=UPI00027125CD|nr:DUF1120 domain-containing protein [Pantoea sp. GM01]EJL85162.1 Protein of unknown function (DUF1120) [Pantoea sp. GM01]
MMKQMTKNACALAVLAATTLGSMPAMASSVDVGVRGSIAPVSCVPTLSGGGAINYGTITADSLAAGDEYTVLPQKVLTLNIACSSPIKVGMQIVNGRLNTHPTGNDLAHGAVPAPPGVKLHSGFVSLATAGLGLDGTRRIGGYSVNLLNPVADGVAVRNAHSLEGIAGWGTSTNGLMFSPHEFRPFTRSWTAATGTVEPLAIENLTTGLQVHAFLNKATELDLAKPVRLDGMATLELIYL